MHMRSHSKSLEMHNSGLAGSRLKLFLFMNVAWPQLLHTHIALKVVKEKHTGAKTDVKQVKWPELFSFILKPYINGNFPSSTRGLLLTSLKSSTKWVQVCSGCLGYDCTCTCVCMCSFITHCLTLSLLLFSCPLEVTLGQAEVEALAYLISVMVMISELLPVWSVQYGAINSENLITVFCSHTGSTVCVWLGEPVWMRVSLKEHCGSDLVFLIIQCLVVEIWKVNWTLSYIIAPILRHIWVILIGICPYVLI